MLEALAADEDLSVAAGLLDGLLVAIDGLLVDDRAQPVLALEWVADGDRLGLLDKQADELVMDGPLDVDPAVGRALLAAEAEGAAHDALGGLIEVRTAGHDGRVLAAHLDDAGSRVARREALEEVHADLIGAREDDAGDARVLAQLGTDRVARAHDEVEDAVRDARIPVGLRQRNAAHGAGTGRLEDDRVAGQHRRRRRSGGQRHREVEGADDGEHAVRAEDRARVHGCVAQVVHGVVVGAVVLPGLGVVADQVGRLLDLAQRLDPVLADLDGHQAAVLHLALADQLGRAAQDRQALLPGRGRPARLCRASGGDGVARVLARALGEGADDDLAVDRRAQLEGAVAIADMAIDEVAVVGTEASLRLLQPGLVGGVERLVVGAQRRVGDLQPGGGLGRHGRQVSVDGGLAGARSARSASGVQSTPASVPRPMPDRLSLGTRWMAIATPGRLVLP